MTVTAARSSLVTLQDCDAFRVGRDIGGTHALIVDPHGRPPRDLVRTVLVLVAADIEAPIVLARGAVLADVGLSPDFHDGAQLDALRAGHGIVTAANIGSRSGNAGGPVGLGGNRVEA